MSITLTALISLGSVLGLAVIIYALLVVRLLRNTKKPLPIDTGGPVTKLAQDLPLTDEAPTPAMDVYGPQGDGSSGNQPRPVILFVPGDGPEMLLKTAKDWGMFRGYAELSVSRGFVAAVTNHRSSGSYKRAAKMVSDVVNALEQLRQRAEELGIDPTQMFVWTFSGSSGPVISHLLLNPVQGLRGMISFYGLLDLSTFLLKVPEAVIEDYSLPQVLARGQEIPCPIYLLHAGRDGKMITRGFNNTTAAIDDDWSPITTRVYQNGRHGFEVLSPPAEVEAEINAAFAFVDDCVEETGQYQGSDQGLSKLGQQ